MAKYNYNDYIGKKINKLTIKNVERDGYIIYCDCECECGKKKKVKFWNIINNKVCSCGCAKIEANRKHARKIGLANRKEMYCKCCGKAHYAKGLCKNCYERLRRSGRLEYLYEKKSNETR